MDETNDLPQLIIVEPIRITDEMMVSSDVPEDDYPVWVAGTYSRGDRVIVISTHTIYESQVDGNTDNPTQLYAQPKWLAVGFTNRWRAFDESISTQTVQADEIKYTITPGGPASRITFLNLTNATSITVRATDTVLPDVYERTITLGRKLGRSSWWAFFFSKREMPTQADFDDLPGFRNPTFEITITGGEHLAVGVILIGRSEAWGLGVQLGASPSIQNFSRRTEDDFGNVKITRRGYARRLSLSMFVSRGEIDPMQRTLVKLKDTPTLWIVRNGYEATTIYGYLWNSNMLISYPEMAELELELRGLT